MLLAEPKYRGPRERMLAYNWLEIAKPSKSVRDMLLRATHLYIIFLFTFFSLPAKVAPLCHLAFDLDGGMAAQIRALEIEGVPSDIVQTLLTSLEQWPERWQRIGQDIIEATSLTNLIERNSVNQHNELVPLKLLSTTHDLPDPFDLAKLQKRIESLKANFSEIVAAKKITTAMHKKVVPSGSPAIRVAKDADGNYYVFDGNGRTEAIRSVFGSQYPDLEVDVVVYEIPDKKTTQRIRESQRNRRGTEFKN